MIELVDDLRCMVGGYKNDEGPRELFDRLEAIDRYLTTNPRAIQPDPSETTITRSEFMADGYELPKSGRVRVVDEEGEVRVDIGSDPSETGKWEERVREALGQVLIKGGTLLDDAVKALAPLTPSEAPGWDREAASTLLQSLRGDLRETLNASGPAAWPRDGSDPLTERVLKFVQVRILDALGKAPEQATARQKVREHYAEFGDEAVEAELEDLSARASDVEKAHADLVRRIEALEGLNWIIPAVSALDDRITSLEHITE